MIIVGASSLLGSLKTLKPKTRSRLTIDTTGIIRGLRRFLLPQQCKVQRRETWDLAQYRQQYPLAPQEPLLTAHQERYTGCEASQSPPEQNTSHRMLSKAGIPNIYSDLVRTQFPKVIILWDINSRKKAKTPAVVNEYNQLHQKHNLELKIQCVVLKNAADCRKNI